MTYQHLGENPGNKRVLKSGWRQQSEYLLLIFTFTSLCYSQIPISLELVCVCLRDHVGDFERNLMSEPSLQVLISVAFYGNQLGKAF